MSLSPRERIGYAAIGALLLFGFGFVGSRRMRQATPIVFQTPAPAAKTGPGNAVPSEAVIVHVAGAVKFPGVVRLNSSSRVVDAIHAAGGPTSKADLEAINLAAKLVDGTQLRVPSKVAAAQTVTRGSSARVTMKRPVAQIDKSGYFAPVEIAPQYLPRPEVTPVVSNLPAGSASRSASRGSSAKASAEVDLNSATLQDLQGLPGVGPSTAQKILDYRNQHGAFHAADELLAVKGIGPKKLEKMKPFVRV